MKFINIKILSKFTLVFAIFTFLGCNFIYAQNNKDLAKFESLTRLADGQFDFGYYQNAKDYYKRALEISPDDAHANYFIAESCRNLYQYSEASEYYKKASLQDIESYPLSGFYYALMLKYQGNYEKANLEFENFIEKTKYIAPQKFKDKKSFFQRTLIEMEGCYWSLEQLFEYKVVPLPEPVNTKYNDFGVVINKNDSDLLVISGRIESKFVLKNDLGESYTNTYAFAKTDSINWDEIPLYNKLDRINSKFNEGSGVFNKSKDLYFFTSCGREEDGFCKIYLCEKNNSGNWSEPKLLNESINFPYSDNKQPAISANGDTLFFVSNREGGYGDNDLWFSVWNSQSKDWSMAVNMGEDINTPFNEVTPFYYDLENSLFFSSDGHKGFGGLDIFIAKNDQTSGLFSVTNLGSPFNSNLDDFYFALGQTKGYITSNRQGSIGEFDVFFFKNMFVQTQYADYHQKLQELSDELSTLKYNIEIVEPEIPEELITVDYQAIYDRILSAKYAALIHDVVLILTETDYNDYNPLSIDDKSIIDMLYMSMEVNITQEEIDSVRTDDANIYTTINFQEKGFVDKISENYFITTGGAGFIKMSKDENDYYKNLSLEEKQKIDRLIYYKIRNEYDKINSQQSFLLVQDNFGIKDLIDSTDTKISFTYDEYESLISKKLAGLLYSEDLKFNQIENDIFNKMTFDDQNLLEMDYKSRIFDLSEENIANLNAEDKENYNNLDVDSKNLVNQIVGSQYNSTDEEVFVSLTPEQISFYTAMDLSQKRKYDRILAFKFSQLRLDEIALMNSNITDMLPNIDTNLVNEQKQNEYQRLLTARMAGYFYNIRFPYNEVDYILYQTMTSADLGLIDAVYSTQISDIDDKVLQAVFSSDINAYENLTDSDKVLIGDIAQNYFKSDYNALFIRLNDTQKEFYRNLDLEAKKKTDRLIAYKISKLYEEKLEAAQNFSDIQTDPLEITNSEEVSEIFNDVELNSIERLLSYKVAMFIYGLSVNLFSADYELLNNLSKENISILDLLYASKTFTYNDVELLNSIHISDENQYNLLSVSDKDFIDRQIEKYLLSENENVINLTPQDSIWYSELSIDAKYKIDRLFMYKLNSKLNPPRTVISTEEYLISDLLYIEELSQTGKIITPEEYYKYERICSFMIAEKLYNTDLPFIENDFFIEKQLSPDDLSIVDLMYKSKLVPLQDTLIVDSLKQLDKQRFLSASYENKVFVNKILQNTTYNDYNNYIDLEEDDSLFYDNLSIKQKYFLDRLIVMKINSIEKAEQISTELVETIENDELNLNEFYEDNNIIAENETDAFERILAFELASYIYDIELPFNNLDYNLNENLDFDELSILDMIFIAKTISLEESMGIDSIIEADKVIYENLDLKEKNYINEIVDIYSNADEETMYVTLSSDISPKYNNQTLAEKFITDRLVAARLSEIFNKKQIIHDVEESITNDELTVTIYEITENTEIIQQSNYNDYEKVLSFKIANFIHGIELPFISSDYSIYLNMTIDDKSIVDMMYEMRLYSLGDSSVRILLQEDDDIKYDNLSAEDKKLVDDIVNEYVANSGTSNYISLTEENIQKYSNLDIKDKNQIDRILSSKLRTLMFKTAFDDKYLQTDSISINLNEIAQISDIINQDVITKYEKIISFKIANYIYNLDLPYIESDKNILNKLTFDDNSLIDIIFDARIYLLNDEDLQSLKSGDKLLMSNIDKNDSAFISNTVNAYKNQPDASKIILSTSDADFYKNLNIVQKNRIDRLICFSLTNEGFEQMQNIQKTDSVIIKTIIEKEIVKEYVHDTTYIYTGSSTVNPVEIIFFEYNSTQLSDEAKSKLKLINDYCKSKPNSTLIINGYTDDTGLKEYNAQLSYDRATSVFKYFIENGFSKERLNVYSYGIENPLVPNDNEQNMKLNRRVQILIIE